MRRNASAVVRGAAPRVEPARLPHPSLLGPGRKARRHVPGEPELWILLIGDMLLFAALFAAWSIAARDSPEVFAAGRAEAHRVIGLANTIALLTSSWAVAVAVRRSRSGRPEAAARAYLAAAVLGVLFVALKAVEYTEKIRAGADPASDPFDMYYFVVTGMHLGHVVIGVSALLYARYRIRANPAGDTRVDESVASYWHLVDVFWIVLFLLIYVV